jgi:hypothetical protein
MTDCHSSTLPNRSRWLVPLMSILSTIASGCAPAVTTRVTQPPAAQQSTPTQVPGIPNKPDLVTVVPFYWKSDENNSEKTRVYIPAEVDGRQGIFMLDIGALDVTLNRTYVRPSTTGGLDTVLATDTADTVARQHDWSGTNMYVSLRIGTIVNQHTSAITAHWWNNFWPDSESFYRGGKFHLDHPPVLGPKLGHIGTVALEPFETIIDYTHKRLILIRLDSAGHRLVEVPAYTPKWSAPLIDFPSDVPTGNGAFSMQLLGHGPGKNIWGVAIRPDNTIDTVNSANNTRAREMDTGAPTNDDGPLGYPFLSQFGVVGLNHRTHQFILYH